jgi:hypothetical protein
MGMMENLTTKQRRVHLSGMGLLESITGGQFVSVFFFCAGLGKLASDDVFPPASGCGGPGKVWWRPGKHHAFKIRQDTAGKTGSETRGKQTRLNI